MELGSVMTACSLFEKMELWEECIECLSVAGHIDKAKKLALEKVFKTLLIIKTLL